MQDFYLVPSGVVPEAAFTLPNAASAVRLKMPMLSFTSSGIGPAC